MTFLICSPVFVEAAEFLLYSNQELNGTLKFCAYHSHPQLGVNKALLYPWDFQTEIKAQGDYVMTDSMVLL